MNFDVTLTPEPRFMRVQVVGEGGAQRLLSLLQVMEVDCRSWRQSGVLLDLRELQPALPEEDEAQVAAAASFAFAPLQRIAILTRPGVTHDAGRVRAFAKEREAVAWLEAA
jgi:hypothetical protein